MQNQPFSPVYQPFYANPYAQRMQQTAPVQSFYQAPSPGPGVTASMVTNRQEAEAAQIPFDNTVSIFADFAHGKIYTKRFNPQTGAADFCVYCMEGGAEQPQQEYATMAMLESLSKRVEELAGQITDRKGRRAWREDENE